jgi:DNA-binding CsgD family transcriptional regulator
VALTPAIPLVRANPGIKILSTRGSLPGSDAELRRTPFYQEVMQRQGWRHGAVLCFWASPSASFPVLVLTLYRTADQPDFSDQELARLEDVHPFLALAVTRFHQMSAADAVSEGMASALRHVARGVVVLDGELRVVRSNLAGRRACAQWAGTRAAAPSSMRAGAVVPGCVLRVCRELALELPALIRHGGETRAQRRRQVSDPAVPRLFAAVTMIRIAGSIAEPTFVVEFDDRDGAAELRIEVATAPGDNPLLMLLTPAERDVAEIVARGWSNEEVAEALGKSIHAVKFLLHRIYTKLAVPNRSRLSLMVNRNTHGQTASLSEG